MRISSGSQPLSSRVPTGTQEKSPLQRSEMVSDLFNNPIQKEEEKGEVKLRLSYASRRLSKNLREGVETFLKENPEIATSFDAIELPDNAYSRIEINKEPVRKMSAYLNWVRIHEAREGEPEEAEAPFLSIHEAGKDEEMRALFEQQEQERVRQEQIQKELEREQQEQDEAWQERLRQEKILERVRTPSR